MRSVVSLSNHGSVHVARPSTGSGRGQTPWYANRRSADAAPFAGEGEEGGFDQAGAAHRFGAGDAGVEGGGDLARA